MDQFNTERQIAGISYIIRELTNTQIRQWLKDLEQAAAGPTAAPVRWWRKLLYWLGLAPKPIPVVKRDVIDVMLFDGFVMFDLRYLTDLTEQQIGDLTPRQIREVWAACEEVNVDFFLVRRRLEAVGIASPAMTAVISNELSRG